MLPYTISLDWVYHKGLHNAKKKTCAGNPHTSVRLLSSGKVQCIMYPAENQFLQDYLKKSDTTFGNPPKI